VATKLAAKKINSDKIDIAAVSKEDLLSSDQYCLSETGGCKMALGAHLHDSYCPTTDK